MKTSIIKIGTLLIGLSVLFNACQDINTIVPSANVTTQEKFIEDYTGLEISAAFNVDVQFSDTDEKIVIEANENLHQYIEVEKVNNSLRIKIKNGTSVSGNSTLKAHIITKSRMSYYSASGASRIILTDTIDANSITISLSGASSFSGIVKANSITAFIEGASNATLSGTTDMLTANISGASLLGDYALVTQSADINLSGASQASITAEDTIDLTASGASIFKYKGTATFSNINVSGASQVMNMN